MNAADVNECKVMQLATTKGDKPWICTVYFVLHEGNFYWLSLPARRHSKELAANANAAVAIAVKQDLPVIGLQAEGMVARVEELAEIEAVLALYTAKYDAGKQFVERYKAGTNQHSLYKLTPRKIMAFNEMDADENPYQEITITS